MKTIKAHELLPKPLKKALFFLLLLIVFISGMVLQKYNTMVKDTKKLNTVNAHTSDNPNLTFQIKYPSTYFATSDEMLMSYDSQGGLAPPRLLLTKGVQPLGTNTEGFIDYRNVLKNDSCIMVWSTEGYTTFDDWEYLVYPLEIPLDLGGIESKRNDVNVISTLSKKIGKFEVLIREVKDATYPQRMEALVKIPEDKKDTSYFFHTCNTSNKEDLNTVLQNFDVRGNLNL